jgi:hypothetical protein
LGESRNSFEKCEKNLKDKLAAIHPSNSRIRTPNPTYFISIFVLKNKSVKFTLPTKTKNHERQNPFRVCPIVRADVHQLGIEQIFQLYARSRGITGSLDERFSGDYGNLLALSFDWYNRNHWWNFGHHPQNPRSGRVGHTSIDGRHFGDPFYGGAKRLDYRHCARNRVGMDNVRKPTQVQSLVQLNFVFGI